MIKVAHIITRLDFGGAQGNTLHTARTLDKSRYDALIICGRRGDLDRSVPDANIVRAEHLVREISPLEEARAFFELRRLLKDLKPDIVHTHSSKAGILGRLAARSAGVPVIVHTFHGFGFHPLQNPLVRGLYVFMEKVCARFSDALVFVSRSNIETARAAGIGDPARYRLIRSGVALAAYPAKVDRALKRAALGLDSSDTVILSVGNTKPQKNPGHFIEAARRLAPKFPSARFVFAGGGSDLRKYQDKVSELGLGKACRFIGWREDTAELLAASDIFALTSRWEGLPRALVEALRTGLPSVCYAADGVSDILATGKNGCLVPAGDLDGFCSSLESLLGDAALRAKLAAGAAATDLGEFDIDFMVRQQEELYEELLQKKGLKK